MRATTFLKGFLFALIAAIAPLTALGWFPEFNSLIDLEVWLTNHVADPILFAFGLGLLLPLLFSGTVWRAAAKAGHSALSALPRLGATDEPAATEPEHALPARHVEAEPFMPKLVISRKPAPQRPAAAQTSAKAPAKPEPRRSAIPPQPSALDIAMPKPVVQLAAEYARWDKMERFKLWQVAWLWNDWEPVSDQLKNKPCLPSFERLQADLQAGLIPDAAMPTGDCKYVEVGRQALTDYALTVGERPKFLFVEERDWFKSRLRRWRSREIAPDENLDGFIDYSQTKLLLYKQLQIINCDAVAREIKRAMRAGDCQGIARRQIGGVALGFERIPPSAWRRLTIDWLGNISGRNVTYTDLRVKFAPHYCRCEDAPLPQASNAWSREREESLPSAAAGRG